jgi:FkbM family methyltransferase
MEQLKRTPTDTTTMKVGGMDIVLPVRDDFAFVPASLKLPNGEARFYLSFPRRLGNTDNGAKHLVFREIKGGGYEQHTRNLLERAIKAGDLFIDVGAHWGFFTLQAATHPAGNVAVIAFEPDPTNASILLTNIANNGLRKTASVVCAACGDNFDVAPLITASSMGHSVHGVGLKGFTAEAAHWVPVVALDTALNRFPQAANRRVILKIDAEGFEPRVIAGAQTLLKSGRVAMIVWECGQALVDGPERPAMVKMISNLNSLGFHHLREMTQDVEGPLLPFSTAELFEGNIFSYNPNALKDFDKLLPVKSDDFGAVTERGLLLHEQGRFEEALSAYDRALSIKPDAVDILASRGATMLELNRFEEALINYDKLLSIRRNDFNALNMRALILENLKRFEEALAAYDKAIAIAPGAIEPLYNRGNIFADLARFEEALASYDQALAMNPDAPVVLNNRGLVLEELNRFEEALASYEKALKIKPGYEAAVENRRLLLENSNYRLFRNQKN